MLFDFMKFLLVGERSRDNFLPYWARHDWSIA